MVSSFVGTCSFFLGVVSDVSMPGIVDAALVVRRSILILYDMVIILEGATRWFVR